MAGWFAMTNFCNQAGINHLEQMNGLVQNEKYNGGLANLLKFSSIQIKVGLYNVVDIKLANRYINNLGFFKFINS